MLAARLLLPLPRRALQQSRALSFETTASYCAKPADPELEVAKSTKLSPASRWASEQFKRWPAFSQEAGEDMFILEQRETDALLGVSDGVGGWSLQGIDSSVFSKGLCYHTAGHFRTEGLSKADSAPLVTLLDQGYQAVQRDKTIKAGSATACLVHLDAQAEKLQAANLGDSGFAIIRKNRVIHWQPSQIHFFNCPRQLAKIPTSYQTANDLDKDLPDHSDVFTTDLQADDCIVVFTDGVIDNVFPKEFLALQQMFLSSTARKEHGDSGALKRFTNALVSLTWQAQRMDDRESPFTIEARKHRKRMPGGKIDDIAVVSALVLP